MAHFKTTAIAGLAAIALSGCSWLPFGGPGAKAKHAQAYGGQYHAAGGQYGYTPGMAYDGGAALQGAASCQIPSPQHPVPAGCDPASVTIGLPGAGGFAQSPSFGAVGSPAHASGAYGSQVAGSGLAPVAKAEAAYRKPRFRGTLSTGVEKSIRGEYLDYDAFPGLDPELNYDPNAYNEGSSVVDGEGNITSVIYTGIVERVNKPTISNDDVHSTPMTISGGLEYILGPRTTVFGNAGYTYAEGNTGDAVTIDAELRRITQVSRPDGMGGYIDDPTSISFVPNVENVASYAYDTTDMRRIDLQAGARQYLNPLKGMGMPRVTPFVAAAAGASHYNAQSIGITQRQAFYRRAFESGEVGDNSYEVVPADVPVDTVNVYDSQWVPSGQLNAGVEWQATPSTAFAIESGLRVKGGRKYTNGVRESADISVPFTIRGSYNF